MKVILGLGNPGLNFRFSRHNLGFLVIERLARRHKIKIKQKLFNCLLGKGWIGNQEVSLAEPLTFMNLSGEVVALIVKRQKIRLADLLVVCDDVNLPLGKIRIRPKGSAGGHKGLSSIIAALGTTAFPRLRIGVGRPAAGAGKSKLSKYVLGRFNKQEIKTIKETVEEAASASAVWAEQGITPAMNQFN